MDKKKDIKKPKKKRAPRKFEYDPGAPLQKARGESWAAAAALKDYYIMGAGRSLRKLLSRYQEQASNKNPTKKDDPPTTKFNTIAYWSARYRWQERIDDQLRLDTNKDLNLWAQRRQEIRENDYEQGAQIRELALRILAECPGYIKEKIVEDKKAGIITIFQALDGHLMLKAFDLASEMQRLAADMSTENIDAKINDESTTTVANQLVESLMARIEKEMENAQSSDTHKADQRPDA